jgi:hypothetical protein
MKTIGRKKRSDASAENWRPESGDSIVISFESRPHKKEVTNAPPEAPEILLARSRPEDFEPAVIRVYFLETSALVKLCIREAGTDESLRLVSRAASHRFAILSLSCDQYVSGQVTIGS